MSKSFKGRMKAPKRNYGKAEGSFWGKKPKTKPTIDTSDNPLVEWLAKTDPRKSGK